MAVAAKAPVIRGRIASRRRYNAGEVDCSAALQFGWRVNFARSFAEGAHECDQRLHFGRGDLETGHAGAGNPFADQLAQILFRAAAENDGRPVLAAPAVGSVTGGAAGNK